MSQLLLAAALAAAPSPASAMATWWQRLFGRFPEVVVERTAHDIVHLTAPDERSLGYAWGYAAAQDRGCETAEAVITAAGERSRWFGPEAGVRLGGRILDNRTSDFFVRDHMDDRAIERGWNAATPQARAMADGVVAGFDRWLQDLRDDPARARAVPCAGAPWLRPMTIADLRRLGELETVADGSAAWADAIARAQPPGAPPLHEPLPQPPLGQGPGARAAASRAGGLALAFGRDDTASGRGLLLGVQDAPWTGWDRPWPVHVVIPGRLDAMGVAPGTLPMLTSGFNRSLAWSSTRSPARHFTLHALALAPGDPTAYLVDGRREPMTTRQLRTQAVAALGLETVDRVLYATRYGPVVSVPQAGLDWTRGTAYALQDADTADARWLQTWLAVAEAPSVPALREALAGRGTGDQVVVAADAQGRVAYADAGAVPDVDAATLARCLAHGGAGTLWSQDGLAVLDGSRGDCDWHRTPGDPRAGEIPVARTPWLARTDWVQSAGGGFWLAQPAAPGAALPASQRAAWSPLQGGDPAPLPLRERAAIVAVADALRVPRAPLDADALVALWTDSSNAAASLVLDDLLAACGAADTEAQRAGCAALAGWDRTDRVDARGAALFREWWRRARELPGLWRVPFAAGDPLHTPRGLRMPDAPDPATGLSRRVELLEALARAVYALREAGVAPDAPLGALQFVDLGGRQVPLPGGEAAEGTLATVAGRSATALSRLGYEPAEGSAWMQVVSFTADGPRARGVQLQGPARADGDDPARREALAAFASGRWFALPFTRAEIDAQRVGAPLRMKTW